MTNGIFVNLTQHAINLYIGNNLIATIAPSGLSLRVPDPKDIPVSEVRVDADDDVAGSEDGWVFKVVEKIFPTDNTPMLIDHSGEKPVTVGPLPVAEPGKFYIASAKAVLATKPKRTDLLIPDDFVRDKEGRILGCTGFSRA